MVDWNRVGGKLFLSVFTGRKTEVLLLLGKARECYKDGLGSVTMGHGLRPFFIAVWRAAAKEVSMGEVRHHQFPPAGHCWRAYTGACVGMGGMLTGRDKPRVRCMAGGCRTDG